MQRIGYLWLTAGSLAVLATPVGAYWLIGDQSSEGFPEEQLDHVMTPPGWPHETVEAAGTVALSIVLGAALVLGWATRRRQIDPRWLTVVVLLMAVGVIAAGGYRTLTAGVIGANIGAGIVLLFGAPICVALIGWAAVSTRRIIADDSGSSCRYEQRLGTVERSQRPEPRRRERDQVPADHDAGDGPPHSD